MKINRYTSFLLTAFLLLIAVPFTCVSADDEEVSSASSDASTVYKTSFETNDFEGWSAFGGQCVLSLDNVHSCDGAHSLMVSERKAAWSGPAINLTKYVGSGDRVSFTARLQNTTEIEGTFSLTLMVTDIYGTNTYINIDTGDTNPGIWKKLSGTVDIPEDTVDVVFYAEASSESIEFCLDDVTITKTGESKSVVTTEKSPDAPEYSFDFEHSAEGWMPRGDMSINISNQFSYTGQSSLYASERTKTWNGPSVRIDNVIPGKKYNYTAWVMYNGKEYENEHNYQLALQYIRNGEEVYQTIGEKKLQKGTWSKLTGAYAVPKDATDIYLYVQTEFKEEEITQPDDLMSFYIDSVSVIDSSIISRREFRNTLIRVAIAGGILLVIVTITVMIILRSRKTKAALRSASLDFMTKAYNRNAFEKKIEELENEPDKAKNLYFTACDVNFLKHINDNYGHESGDKAITRCASILLRSVSKKGSVYRTGGDEFVCISPENPVKKIQTEFMAESNKYEGYPFSIAVGTAAFESDDPAEKPDIQSILNAADQAMYKDKQRIKAEFSEFLGMDTKKSGAEKDNESQSEQQEDTHEAEEDSDE